MGVETGAVTSLAAAAVPLVGAVVVFADATLDALRTPDLIGDDPPAHVERVE